MLELALRAAGPYGPLPPKGERSQIPAIAAGCDRYHTPGRGPADGTRLWKADLSSAKRCALAILRASLTIRNMDVLSTGDQVGEVN